MDFFSVYLVLFESGENGTKEAMDPLATHELSPDS